MVYSTIQKRNAFEYATYPETNIPYEALITCRRYFLHVHGQLLIWHDKTSARSLRALYTKGGNIPLIYTYPTRVGSGVWNKSTWFQPPTTDELELDALFDRRPTGRFY
jgi:hypothetical protein